MKFLHLVSALCLIATSTTTTAIVLRRDALSDVQTVDSDIRTLTYLSNSYDGSTGGIGPILAKYNTYAGDLNTTIANLKASSCTPLASLCTSVTNYLVNTVSPDLTTFLNAYVAIKPKFPAGAISTMRRVVGPQPRAIWSDYCSALQPRCPSSALSTFCGNVQTAYSNAQTRFG